LQNHRRRQLKRCATAFLLAVIAGSGKFVGGAIAAEVLLRLHGILG
jgi:hypothetical protein